MSTIDEYDELMRRRLHDQGKQYHKLVDQLTFGELILEVECNCKVIDRDAVLRQLQEDLKRRTDEATQLVGTHMDTILAQANDIRNW